MKVLEFSSNRGSVPEGAGERYGIELEVENASIPDRFSNQRDWSYVEDGSLRNSGLEFLTKPLGWDALDGAFERFYGWFERYSWRTSVRTSTHVHCNVLDFTLEELGASLAAYAVVEPLLFRVCGQEREENIYCVPWYRAPEQAQHAGRVVGGDYGSIMSTCKYSSLYLEPLNRFGTLEFRQAPLFETQGELKLWLELIRAVVYNSRDRWGTADSVLEFVNEQGCEAFVDELFGATLARTLRTFCHDTAESIIDDADSITVAECISPLLCTYKATDDAWTVPVITVEGNGQAGYRNVAFGNTGNADVYAPEYGEDDPDEWYEDHDEEF